METFQEFIDKFSSKRSSNTWKHRPAKSWDILKFERFSSFMGSKNLKPCTRQKLWRWNCLQFLKLTKLKLIPSQSWGTPKAESFSNWDLHKLKQFKGLKIHPYWMLRRRTQEFFPILENVFYLAKDEAVKNLTAFARETLSAFVIWYFFPPNVLEQTWALIHATNGDTLDRHRQILQLVQFNTLSSDTSQQVTDFKNWMYLQAQKFESIWLLYFIDIYI